MAKLETIAELKKMVEINENEMDEKTKNKLLEGMKRKIIGRLKKEKMESMKALLIDNPKKQLISNLTKTVEAQFPEIDVVIKEKIINDIFKYTDEYKELNIITDNEKIDELYIKYANLQGEVEVIEEKLFHYSTIIINRIKNGSFDIKTGKEETDAMLARLNAYTRNLLNNYEQNRLIGI